MEKIYCGSAKEVQTNFGTLTKVSFHKDDILKIQSYMQSENVEWVNLVIKEKKEKLPNKPTHYLEVDTWKPNSEAQTPPQTPPQAHIPKQNYANIPKVEDDLLPF